jgi:hypothetical protein
VASQALPIDPGRGWLAAHMISGIMQFLAVSSG